MCLTCRDVMFSVSVMYARSDRVLQVTLILDSYADACNVTVFCDVS